MGDEDERVEGDAGSGWAGRSRAFDAGDRWRSCPFVMEGFKKYLCKMGGFYNVLM